MNFNFFKSRLNSPHPRRNIYSATALFCLGFIVACFLAGLLGVHYGQL